jgi:hypothetical protein
MTRTAPNTWEPSLTAAEHAELALLSAWGRALGAALEQVAFETSAVRWRARG